MWLIIFLFIGPIVYLIVSNIVDSISDKVNAIERKRYYGEEELIHFTTYKNDNITKEDLMLLFVSQISKHRQRYFNIKYNIFNAKEEQNYAWSVKTTKKTFGWGIIYNIRFHFSNGWVYLSFSNKKFYSNEKTSLPYSLEGTDFGNLIIGSTLSACRDEAKMIWKMTGMKPEENLPFDYISLSDNNRISSNSNTTKDQNEKKSSQENSTQVDLLTFYRNLLGLKLRFSQIELKTAYREAAVKYHPDRYGSSSPRDRENAEMLMKQVNDAYRKLKEVTE